MKRIKHNDLTHYFLRPHQELPASYLKSCEKFFKELIQKRIRENMGLKPGEVDDGTSNKRQASSTKRQAASLKELDPTVDWNKLIDTLKN